MTRRRSTRGTRYTRSSRRNTRVRIRGVERTLFVLGAMLYLIGVFGGINLVTMPATTVILLLGIGGGLLLVITLTLIY